MNGMNKSKGLDATTTTVGKRVESRAEQGTSTSTLDISDEAISELTTRAVELVTDYFKHISELPIFPQTSAEKIAEQFPVLLADEPESLDRLFADMHKVIEGSRHNGHPRFFGYIASPSTPIGAFADLIASAINQNVPAWRSSPAATQIERTVVRWLSLLISYTPNADGLLTSGGSMANLSALYIAHRTKARAGVGDAGALDASRRGLWNAPQPMTIYVSDQTHMSVAKAANILGIGTEQVRVVSSDERFHMDVRGLRERIELDKEHGLQPFCVVATAGTTNTGAVDPLSEIAEVARAHDLWFHVDGAYGAPAALDPSKRPLFAGLELADSVALDPHKWLYAPIDCGCLLWRDNAQARAAWRTEEADYLKVFEQTEDETFAFFDFGMELSRRFRALKIWLMLRYYGAARVAAAIIHDNEIAAYFAERIEASEDFELLAPVELSICCFRYVPADARRALTSTAGALHTQTNAELDELNSRIMYAVQRGGRAYISNTLLHGRFSLRACITNFRTTRADVDATLDIIREAAQALLAP